jgi:hypothetical protein
MNALLSRPRALSELLLAPPPYTDGGLEPTLMRSIRTRRGLTRSRIPLTHGSAQEEGMKEEWVHRIQDPSDPWQRAGGGAAPDRAAVTGRRRGGALVKCTPPHVRRR